LTAPPPAADPAQPGPRQSRRIALDFEQLRRRGMLTPDARRSRLSEEIRLIKRRLMQRMDLPEAAARGVIPEHNVILVTSARPVEGKSFIAANLALSFAIDEAINVLLIDADVARPNVGNTLGIELAADQRGLTDILRDPALDMTGALLRCEDLPLTVMPQGSQVASATELFGGRDMTRLVDDIANRYADRVIVFDSPPLLATTEPVALAEHVDQIVFVVEAGRTSPDAVAAALELLQGTDKVSFVLNRCSTLGNTDQFGAYYPDYAVRRRGRLWDRA
jgi:receptor protein-tyrosine kinase